MRIYFLMGLLLQVAFSLSAQQHNEHEHQHQSHTSAVTAPAVNHSKAQSLYVCPMHPEVQQDKPGSCPICGMHLVEKTSHTEHDASHTKHEATPTDAKTIFACPMHPQIQQDKPGSCPICGMHLVEKQRQSEPSVNVSGAIQQALAIRVATVKTRTLERIIDSFAQVQYPEDAIYHSHIRAEGWIEQLYVRTLGQQVKAGDKLFSYYAPDLLVAQDDYLQALSVSAQNGERSASLVKRAQTRLRLLGLAEKDIQQLQQTKQSQYHITAYAQQDGVITMLNVRDGMFIRPSDTLMEITQLDRVWLVADVPEAQQRMLATGMAAEVDIPAQHQNAIKTKVDFIYPALDVQSRSSKVRMSANNRAKLFQPNMLLPVRLYGTPLTDVLTVPREAVLLSDKASRVIIKHDDNFSVRTITTGYHAQDYVEVLSGLMPDEQIVVSGQFLLDAEASLSQLPVSSASAHQH
ncbi:efflux RND transporter periplasmic adaptor subunit [Rheinheimera sp. D18]|uniref:efflux RND transporter periplasmic adaptor subunit n=1 Tax=Rheinheimera sp. D18 TaxID=2545632 RepID=UPI0010450A20|nr:efflux RND transporter periplasmic adaptor subunit [Rheinheimera sp. D18]QBL08551.1 efflux RND transporter periplasmic adaptor subunit [Rheinheimera sp. D18]